MEMRIDESRQDGRPAAVDPLGVRPGRAGHVARITDGDDPRAGNGDRRRHRGPGATGQDARVLEEEADGISPTTGVALPL